MDFRAACLPKLQRRRVRKSVACPRSSLPVSLWEPRPRGDQPTGPPLSSSASTHLGHGPLSWNDSTVDTETDPKLAAKLQTGEGIWLNRHWRAVFSASYIGAGALLFVIVMVASEGPVPLLAVLLTGLSSLVAAWMWGAVLFGHLRFSGTTMETTNVFPCRRRLSDIVAARIVGPWRDYYAVYACRLTPGRGKGVRWALLWNAPSATSANTLLAELQRRCGLTEVSPISKDYHTTVWQRPSFDPSPLALKWWQK
jgi:hypothetical protein